ncbi:MAG: class I SAM-dependent methyltransferase [Chlorogloeopsis fritschii C42_A2020_084]|uniref:class I SAM-dependent methyltransferase n=1 Tax=Chlorogloeopsis fritschii TaxID=1124 RepID=UPI001A0A8FC6|nr:class I SAM-dependent methyltransferase [Chlorogloeopsis fritschii]MBF2005961.1 class I SAM-dependent methyltransferase [Chlorogloeopsis fritschii C42_A2020_084]
MLEAAEKQIYKRQLLTDFNSRTNYDQGKFYTPVAKKLLSLVKLGKGQKILDVATGTGIVALDAATIVGSSGKVIGVDISTGMLNNAKQKLVMSGLQNVEFIEADADDLNFSDNYFDAILCSLAICYLTNIPNVLYQWYNLLKSNGIVGFNAWSENAFSPSRIFREVAARYGIKIPNPNEPLGKLEKCHQFLQEAGFQDINVQTEQFGWYFIPDTHTAEELWVINSKNVFGYQVFQLLPNQLEKCRAEYVAEIQALPTTTQGAWCDAPIFFVTASKPISTS